MIFCSSFWTQTLSTASGTGVDLSKIIWGQTKIGVAKGGNN